MSSWYVIRLPDIPLHTIDAEHIVEELVNLLARVGVPKEILSDPGSNFTSQLLGEVYRLLHIQPIRMNPYHSQTGGLVERFNQTLKTMLRMLFCLLIGRCHRHLLVSPHLSCCTGDK